MTFMAIAVLTVIVLFLLVRVSNLDRACKELQRASDSQTRLRYSDELARLVIKYGETIHKRELHIHTLKQANRSLREFKKAIERTERP